MISPPTTSSASQRRIRVMIVDDSAVIRAVISRTLRGHDDIDIVGTATNGEEAVKNIQQFDPDIIVLDIEMPVMDGLAAVPLLLEKKPGVRILICSTLSARGADISTKALTLGASECLLKPGGNTITTANDFQENLIRIIRSLSYGLKKNILPLGMTTSAKSDIVLRKDLITLPPRILAIGSSTGGPKVLIELLSALKNLPIPIVVTQHIPKTFTAMLAQNLTKSCGVPCFEGQNGQAILPGNVYIAPGGYHMTLKKSGNEVVIQLNEEPPENYCRPSVNPMLRSLLPIYGNRILTVILTGMGSDGLQGCTELVNHNAQVIAQNEATSTVWGMPGAVAAAGLCSAVLPPEGLADWIKRNVKGSSL